jgi:hypothetical protein
MSHLSLAFFPFWINFIFDFSSHSLSFLLSVHLFKYLVHIIAISLLLFLECGYKSFYFISISDSLLFVAVTIIHFCHSIRWCDQVWQFEYIVLVLLPMTYNLSQAENLYALHPHFIKCFNSKNIGEIKTENWWPSSM